MFFPNLDATGLNVKSLDVEGPIIFHNMKKKKKGQRMHGLIRLIF